MPKWNSWENALGRSLGSSLVVSYIKIWVGFPYFNVYCCCFWPAAAKWATKHGRRETQNRKKYILVGCGNQILGWTSISSVFVCPFFLAIVIAVSGAVSFGSVGCQLLTCRQWRQLRRSVSICKLYVLTLPENQMPFKVNLKHFFFILSFLLNLYNSFQSFFA